VTRPEWLPDKAVRRPRPGSGILILIGVLVATVVGGAALWAATGRPPATGGLAPPATATAYDGPLAAPGRLGAAGRAVECLHPPSGSNRSADVYAGGATSSTAQGAVDTAFSEGLFLDMPRVDLAVAATEPDRELFTYEVDGSVLLAVVVRNGPASPGAGGDGWYVETVARCDFSEFPEADAQLDGLVDYGVWADDEGTTVPVSRIYSTPGPEHCDWQDMTFLVVGEGERRGAQVYVEAPIVELRDYMSGTFLTDIRLPNDAIDTGWQRDGRRLWLSPDDRYAYVGSSSSVDGWPRFDAGCA
jgi:hypothetical protein